MTLPMTRRQLLALPLGLLLLPRPASATGAVRRNFSYRVDMGVLFDLLTFHVTGTVMEEIDYGVGRYRVVLTGEGTAVTHRSESIGTIRSGHFLPTAFWSSGTVRGREHRSWMRYDYAHGTIDFHSYGHTLFLGRVRQVDDVLKMPAGQPVDDLASATLNFAAGQLETDAHGYHRTVLVRRAKAENEGLDDVSASGYRAELVPLRFRVAPDSTGRLAASIDITRFSSWGRANQPAHVTFDESRHVESVKSALMFGSSVSVRLTSAS
jgi:hypothetical protein